MLHTKTKVQFGLLVPEKRPGSHFGHMTLVILRLSHLMDTPYENRNESIHWFLRKICLDDNVAAQKE